MSQTPPSYPREIGTAHLIARPDQLGELKTALEGITRLALDTESNSLYAYTEQICLIQLSTDRADFLIDPISLDRDHLAFLGEICANSAVEKVLHAAEYDIMVLRRDLGFNFAHVFDTMIAVRVLGQPNIGLAALLNEHYGVELNKSHQRANWGHRPIAPGLLDYAQLDVHYLLPLRDRLHQSLASSDQLEEASELFAEVCQARWRGSGFDPEGFWNINGSRTLPHPGLAIIRELYHYREDQARQLNMPVFKVMSDAALLKLASARPRSLDEMRQNHMLSDSQIRRYGREIIGCIKRGSKADPPQPIHRSSTIDDTTLRRFEALHNWRKEKAVGRGVSSDIIISKDALWELASTAPRTLTDLSELQYLGPWRRKAYGDEILRILSNVDNSQ